MIMEDEAVPKRKRVTQACENCRTLKSKCDGKQPVCGRCRGYGYTCQWKQRKGGLANSNLQSPQGSELKINLDEVAALRNSVEKAQEMLRRLHGKLEPNDQHAVEMVLSDAALTPSSVAVSSPSSDQLKTDLLASYPLRRPSAATYRYLGEVSDVSFFNSVKKVLQSDTSNCTGGPQLESYEREVLDLTNPVEDTSSPFPNRKIADGFVNIFFSTLHVAYPFICRQQFMKDYNNFWTQPSRTMVASSFNSLLLNIFAIGSHYSVCALPTEHSGVSAHSSYFRRAVALYCQLGSERTIENVTLLLAQSFYLLATCQTDGCWTTLGLAIRTAQSIGLHDEAGLQITNKGGQVTQEYYRRTWYSLYVLDRLLSLQLGRPSAIRNRDFQVKLPSRFDDAEFDLARGRVPESSKDPHEPKPVDYHLEVIKFSAIIGHVMRDIYRPSMIDYSEDMLARTDRLDAELLNWKTQLPRWLRFDRGHTFERSNMLKKQRNMLGIKFHHLRALIHRPYLCLPWLQRNDNNIKILLERHSRRVVFSERICVREAQETAHMLHDVTDKKSLIEDFPWWQMISCLICASSILLVMRAFVSSSPSEEDSSREVLEEDSNTCLKVFDALSTNSEAARLARDMLQNLREIRTQGQVAPDEDMTPATELSAGENSEEFFRSRHVGSQFAEPGSHYLATAHSEAASLESNSQFPPTPAWNWPSEIADTMAWSFQFMDTVDPTVLNASYT